MLFLALLKVQVAESSDIIIRLAYSIEKIWRRWKNFEKVCRISLTFLVNPNCFATTV